MQVSRFPRIRLAHTPTPLEHLPNLTRALNGPEIWIKRDDCTGLSTGGNKARKLEFLMAAALEEGADLVITNGAIQSNHARQTAAACARLGLACHLVLENRTGKTDYDYAQNANVLLDLLHGATIERFDALADANGQMLEVAARLKADGRKVYPVPGGGSNATGALGYVNAAMEMIAQTNDAGLRVDHVVHATGSAGTQAGLVVGLEGTSTGIQVLGIGVRAPREKQEENVFRLARLTAEMLGMPDLIRREHVVANCDYVGAGYGFPTEGTLEAIRMLATLEGILLDPVYSGKGMAGLIDLCRKGFFKKGENILFVHTGGSISLTAYAQDFGTPGA